jgi:hypothetical protein
VPGGGDLDQGVVPVVMAMDQSLVEPTLAVIRDIYRHPEPIEVVAPDLESIRSDAFRTDRRKLAYVVATFPGPSSGIIEALSDVDVAVVIWELDEHAFDVEELFIRSKGEIRWRGNASTTNAVSALSDYFWAMRRSGDERIAAVQRWRGAAEALLLELEVVLEERDALLAELRQAQSDLVVAGARIEQLESLTAFLRTELYRSAGHDDPKRVGLVATLVIAVVAAIAGATANGVITDRLVPVNQQAHTTVVVCEAPSGNITRAVQEP